jgi:hypothetical protein
LITDLSRRGLVPTDPSLLLLLLLLLLALLLITSWKLLRLTFFNLTMWFQDQGCSHEKDSGKTTRTIQKRKKQRQERFS